MNLTVAKFSYDFSKNHRLTYLTIQSPGQGNPYLFIAVCPGWEVELGFLGIFRYLLNKLSESFCLRLEDDIFGKTCIQIDLVKSLQARCVLDHGRIPHQSVDIPRLASDITGVKNGFAVALEDWKVRQGVPQQGCEYLRNMTAPGQWLASNKVTRIVFPGSSSISVGVSSGSGFWQQCQPYGQTFRAIFIPIFSSGVCMWVLPSQVSHHVNWFEKNISATSATWLSWQQNSRRYPRVRSNARIQHRAYLTHWRPLYVSKPARWSECIWLKKDAKGGFAATPRKKSTVKGLAGGQARTGQDRCRLGWSTSNSREFPDKSIECGHYEELVMNFV